MGILYFDNNATTRVDPEVVKIMQKYYLEIYGNAGSVHSMGLSAHDALDHCRKIAAESLKAKFPEIIFTSGGTESDNLALQGVMFKAKMEKPNIKFHLITDTIEHPAVFNTAKFLETQGFEITYLPVDHVGKVNPKDVERAIRPETKLISIMYANNEIGTINPISEIGKIAHQNDILFHTDAVQAYTKTLIDSRKENIDLLSVSAHKFYGPKGTGFLFVKNDEEELKNESSAHKFLLPIMYGGSQEFNMRPATENIPQIVGMGKAIELSNFNFVEENTRLREMQEYLIKHILSEIENTELNGSSVSRIPNNINICFHDISAYDLMIELDNENLAVSVGAACHAQSIKPSRVLLGIGRSQKEAESSMRISTGRWTSFDDIEKLLQILVDKVPKLRKYNN